MVDEHISGGISGAITNLYSKEAQMYAIQAYETIRNNKYDVEKIAKNLNMNANKIAAIKNYLFYEKYVDEDGVKKRFDPNFAIAQSWNRLAYEPDNIQEHDIILIEHESMELGLVLAGASQSIAHEITSQKFDYSKAMHDYYENLKTQQKHIHKETDMDIETMEYFEKLNQESNLREDDKKIKSIKKSKEKSKGGR